MQEEDSDKPRRRLLMIIGAIIVADIPIVVGVLWWMFG